MSMDNPDHPWAAGPPVWPEFDAEIEMPEALWSSVLREMDPRPVQTVLQQVRWRLGHVAQALNTLIEAEGKGGIMAGRLQEIVELVEQASGDTHEMPGLYPAGLVESVPREIVAAVIPYLKEGDEPPDNSVGIWGNGWAALAAELELAMDGKLTCPQCGGEQYAWDEGGQDVTCPKCNGAGVVRIGAEK
jgi:hypothetical protein